MAKAQIATLFDGLMVQVERSTVPLVSQSRHLKLYLLLRSLSSPLALAPALALPLAFPALMAGVVNAQNDLLC